MPTRNERFSRKQITILSRMTKKRQGLSHEQSRNWWLTISGILALALIGWYTGHFSGASQVPMAATVVPLLFGLLTVVLLHNVTWEKLVAVLVFVVAFSQGHRTGQWVDEPFCAHEMLKARGHLDTISNTVFDELILLDVQMRKLQLNGKRHNSILYGVGATIVENANLSESEKVAALKQYRAELHEIAK
jgi:hypothetical protein